MIAYDTGRINRRTKGTITIKSNFESPLEKAKAIATELERLNVRLARLEWVQYTTGFDFGVNQAEREYTSVLKDKRNYRTVLGLLERDLDPLDRRRVTILHHHFRPFHLSDKLNRLDDRIRAKTTELSQLLNNHRPRIDGREIRSTEIAQVLRSSPDRNLRKRVFLARAQVNLPLVRAGFLELIKMRRDFARLYKSKDFVEYRLERDELSPRVFDGWSRQAAKLRHLRNEVNAALGRRFLKDERVMPWDSGYLEAKLAPQMKATVDMAKFYEPVRDLFLSMGFDLDRCDITFDIYPRRHKSEWGYNFTIEQGRDSRVLANVEGRYQELGVLLHETGHAVHSFSLDPGEIMLNMGVSGIVAEGVANLFADLQYHRTFYRRFLKGDLKKIEAGFVRLKSYHRANAFAAMSSIIFDQELYRRELKTLDDINHLYWQVNRDILDEKPHAGQPTWGFRIHHTTHPIYLHNYFLGDLTNRMLKQIFCRRHRAGDIMDKPEAFGKFIRKEVMEPSGRQPFLELFERISGERFSLKYLEG
jgi:oligoendopeptidase F